MARTKYPGVPNSRPRRTILNTSDLISRSNGVSNWYLEISMCENVEHEGHKYIKVVKLQ
jgi:hypothetical protein